MFKLFCLVAAVILFAIGTKPNKAKGGGIPPQAPPVRASIPPQAPPILINDSGCTADEYQNALNDALVTNKKLVVFVGADPCVCKGVDCIRCDALTLPADIKRPCVLISEPRELNGKRWMEWVTTCKPTAEAIDAAFAPVRSAPQARVPNIGSCVCHAGGAPCFCNPASKCSVGGCPPIQKQEMQKQSLQIQNCPTGK